MPTIFYAEDQNIRGIRDFAWRVLADEISFEDTDLNCREMFSNALNQIVSASEIPLPEEVDINRKWSNRLIVDAVNISARRIVYQYRVQGDWQKYFFDKEFFIEYSEDISATPKDIAVIPFLCNVLPIAWVLDAEIVVETLDYDFYSHLDEIKQGYINMYPRIKFGGKLTVETLAHNDYEVSEASAAFFSGGADSFNTLITHAEEHPTLITLLGADIKFDDIAGWENVSKHALETAEQFQCKNLFITSSFRLFLNEGALTALVWPLANDGWWHGFQHGIGIISHAAPYAYLHKLKRIYIASSFIEKYKVTCASAPTIDNYLHISKCTTIHDGYEFSRQDKIRRICEYSRRTGIPIYLRSCFHIEKVIK